MVIPVIGFHRSGTSLVASLLEAFGINMGDELLAGDEANPSGYFEDVDFLQLNKEIIRDSGGSWHKPPSQKRLVKIGAGFEGRIKELITQKARDGMWGWKDPRNCLTAELFHDYLHNPHYIIVRRRPSDVFRSLTAVHGGVVDWELTLNHYNECISRFLHVKQPDHVLHVQFEQLVSRDAAMGEVFRLATFANVYRFEPSEVISRIRFRDVLESA